MLLAVALVLVVHIESYLFAQTPWSAAPASPASLPQSTALAPPNSQQIQNRGKWNTLPPPPKTGQPQSEVTVFKNQDILSPSAKTASVNSGMPAIGFPPLPSEMGQTTSTQQPLVSYSNLSPNSSPGLAGNIPQNKPQATSAYVSTPVVEANGPPGIVTQEFNEGDLIAVVGAEHILAGDMMIFVEPIIDQNRGRITPAQEKQLRTTLIRQVLVQYVQIKALYQEFFRDMAGNKPPKEIESIKTQVTTKAGQIFFEKQVPLMMKKYKVNDPAALEKVLREKSMSVSAYRTQFIERILSSELERKYVPEEYEFSREELLGFYQAHPDEWTVTGRARWRELCVRFSKHSREEAERLIREMGNQVYLGGRPFEAVAKSLSEGFTAAEGGVYDWTTQGSLKSTALDTAIFSLPLRRLSLVIEDESGFHIIEVLEREDGHTKSFDLAQVDIRKKLAEEKQSKLLKEFHNKVMARTPVWTKWPEDIPGSRDLSEAIGN